MPEPWGLRRKDRRPPRSNQFTTTVRDFLGGLDDTSDLIAIQPGYGRRVENVDWRRRYLERRPGSVQVGQELPGAIQWLGLYYNREAASRHVMCISDDSLYALDEADTSQSPYGTWKGAVSGDEAGTADDVCCSGTGLVSVEQYNNRLWITDGVTATKYTEDPVSAIQPWSFEHVASMPAPVLSASAVTGELTDASDYNCKVTYRDPLTGEETNGSPVSNTITTSASGHKIAGSYGPDPNWLPQYSEVKIYRCFADETSGLWRFEETVSGVTDLDVNPITFDLDVADGALGSSTVPTSHNAVTPAKYILLFDDTFVLWGFPDELTQARYSLVGEPWSWPSTSFVEVNKKDGEALNSCHIGFHQVIAIKDRSTHILSRDENFGFVREEIPQYWGTPAGRGVAANENTLQGMDQKGTWVFDTNTFTPTGARIQTFLETVRSAGLIALTHALSAKTPYGNLVLFWVQDDAALADPNRTMVFDVRTNGWALWDGIDARVAAGIPLLNNEELVFCGTTDGVVFTVGKDMLGNLLWDDWDGSAIDVIYQTAPIGLQPDESGIVPYKVWLWIELAVPRHAVGHDAEVTVRFFTEMDDPDGAGFATTTYTPHTTGPDMKLFKLHVPVAIASEILLVQFESTGPAQDFRLSAISAVAAPTGRRLS